MHFDHMPIRSRIFNFFLVNVGQRGAFMAMTYSVLVCLLHVKTEIQMKKTETGVFSGMI